MCRRLSDLKKKRMHLSSYHVSLEKTDFESKKKATLYNKELAVDFVCTQTEHGCLASCLNTIVPPPHSPAGRLMIWVHVRIIFSQHLNSSLFLCHCWGAYMWIVGVVEEWKQQVVIQQHQEVLACWRERWKILHLKKTKFDRV